MEGTSVQTPKHPASLWPEMERRRGHSQAVRVGDTIHVSGTFGIDRNGVLVSNVNMERQVRQAYVNLTDTLTTFGATLADVVSETVFVTSMADAQLARNLDAAYEGTTPPARTVVEVSRLALPYALVQIACIARVP